MSTVLPNHVKTIPLHDGTEVFERLGRLETSVESLASSVKALADSYASSRQTNWGVVASFAVVVLALYAAAISPIHADVERAAAGAERLASAVLLQNDNIQKLQIEQALQHGDAERLRADFNAVRDQGSPITDKRLAILEYKAGIK